MSSLSRGRVNYHYICFRAEAYFDVIRRSSMESLKVLAARTVAARVTSEESLNKLEVPKSLLGDLLVAHQDPWSWRNVTRKKSSIPFDSGENENEKKVNRTILYPGESSLKMKKDGPSKKKYLVTIPTESKEWPPNQFVWLNWPLARE